MSVLKSEILSFCNTKLIRNDSIADIIDEINLVLDDLSKMGKWPDLYRANVEADRVTLSSGTSSSNLPTGLRVLDYIVINDGDSDGAPLTELEFNDWLEEREDESSSNYDEPVQFARRGKQLFWQPIPDGAYTAKFWFWRHHPGTSGETEDILFGNEFDRVIKYGVCAEVAKTHKMTGYIELWEGRYLAEVVKMVPEEDLITTTVRYHDV